MLFLFASAWLTVKAATLKSELERVNSLLVELKEDVFRNDLEAAEKVVDKLKEHTSAARAAGQDPLWTAARIIPWLGANFQAASEVATSADDVVRLGVEPLTSVFRSLDWTTVIPGENGMDLEGLKAAEPRISSAAYAVRLSADRLNQIELEGLLPQVARPIADARRQLDSVRSSLDAAAASARIAPTMLGIQAKREYLLMIQNNAETRASGGIPGALAVLTIDKGQLSLGGQSTAGDIGAMVPSIPVEQEQTQIYSERVGKFVQDVNLTPDFPTTAITVRAMWEKKTGTKLDGVISVDPVALSYVLDATGPVAFKNPRLQTLADGRLPSELTGANVVRTLLSDVYMELPEPAMQDLYFAGVSKEIFAALSAGNGDAKTLLNGLARGVEEGRILVWSAGTDEQAVIAKYPLGGSIAGPSVSPAQFGVYFNDGTGAKMDYYVKRTVQLVEECTGDEYGQVKVRVTSTNTAPADAATSLPAYVTGGGVFGVPAGTVRTNVAAYGPVQATVESAVVDGTKSNFGSYLHRNRPVAMVTVSLAPGQSSSVEFTFGKIVQHTEPNLVVTPTVQAVKDVVLATEPVVCGPAK